MKPLDLFIQRLRIRQAARHIPPGARLVDIGCADGALFREVKARIHYGLGLDPGIERDENGKNYRLIRGAFPADLPIGVSGFDAITMLAVLEHIPLAAQAPLANDIARHLKSGGRLIVTVPSPIVDPILEILKKFRLIDGMSLEEHFGFDIRTVDKTFTKAGLKLVRHERFQLGLNNLFVFEKK